ncbi:hypothetical protein ACFLUA_03450 [Chloroflexota bacterium]
MRPATPLAKLGMLFSATLTLRRSRVSYNGGWATRWQHPPGSNPNGHRAQRISPTRVRMEVR